MLRFMSQEEKLPRAFALGAAVGINFSLERRIVHTHLVNHALILAQEHDAGEQFAQRMLHEHFELLHDPNNPELLREVLHGLGVPLGYPDPTPKHLATPRTPTAPRCHHSTQNT